MLFPIWLLSFGVNISVLCLSFTFYRSTGNLSELSNHNVFQVCKPFWKFVRQNCQNLTWIRTLLFVEVLMSVNSNFAVLCPSASRPFWENVPEQRGMSDSVCCALFFPQDKFERVSSDLTTTTLSLDIGRVLKPGNSWREGVEERDWCFEAQHEGGREREMLRHHPSGTWWWWWHWYIYIYL